MAFADRVDAGRRLADALEPFADQDVVVLGLPRGGVPVAFEVAMALHAPLDVLVVRKLGVPFQPELAMGAVGESGVKVLNDRVLAEAQISEDEIAAVEQREREVIDRRIGRFRAGRPPVPLAGRTALIVDDGIATGSTARAACQVGRAKGARRVVLAVPVGPPDLAGRLADSADEVVCLETPSLFFAIGEFYRDFAQTSDEQVADLLSRAASRDQPPPDDPHPDPPQEVRVSAGGAQVSGHLTVPPGARSLVIFAHGSGSSRHSPRNRQVARVLNDAGLATLLFDLLTPEEERDRGHVFDVELLAQRLRDVTDWVLAQPATATLAIGYFGASTGAAAALRAAALPGSPVHAVVSRGGRPDLAEPGLDQVRAPTLLIVGEHDEPVLGLNRQAHARLRCEAGLAVVPGATHLFEEPGTLQIAAELARDWFVTHLMASRTAV